MPKIEWEESYSIGIPELDAEHKVFFYHVNALRTIMMGSADSSDNAENVFKSLLDFVFQHFINEEVYLHKQGDDSIHSHIEEHSKFLNEIRELYVCFKSGESTGKLISLEITAVLTEWLQLHELGVDKKIGK